MTKWTTHQYEDEDLPRSYTTYRGIQCLIEPSKDNIGKFDISIYTGEGDWRVGEYRFISIRDTYKEENYKGIEGLENAKQECIDEVELYLQGKIEPIISERSPTSFSSYSVREKRTRSKKKRTRSKKNRR